MATIINQIVVAASKNEKIVEFSNNSTTLPISTEECDGVDQIKSFLGLVPLKEKCLIFGSGSDLLFDPKCSIRIRSRNKNNETCTFSIK